MQWPIGRPPRILLEVDLGHCTSVTSPAYSATQRHSSLCCIAYCLRVSQSYCGIFECNACLAYFLPISSRFTLDFLHFCFRSPNGTSLDAQCTHSFTDHSCHSRSHNTSQQPQKTRLAGLVLRQPTPLLRSFQQPPPPSSPPQSQTCCSTSASFSPSVSLRSQTPT